MKRAAALRADQVGQLHIGNAWPGVICRCTARTLCHLSRPRRLRCGLQPNKADLPTSLRRLSPTASVARAAGASQGAARACATCRPSAACPRRTAVHWHPPRCCQGPASEPRRPALCCTRCLHHFLPPFDVTWTQPQPARVQNVLPGRAAHKGALHRRPARRGSPAQGSTHGHRLRGGVAAVRFVHASSGWVPGGPGEPGSAFERQPQPEVQPGSAATAASAAAY